MAELNFGLLNPPGSQSIGNAFVSGMDQARQSRLQEQQLQQSMQQNELAKAKMGEYQRGVAEQNALRNRMTQPGFDINNPQHQQEILGIAPVLGQTVLQHAATMRKTGAETLRTGAQTEETRVKTVQAKRASRDQVLRDMANNPSDANIIANHEDAVLQGLMTPDESARQIDTLLKIPLDKRKAIFERAGAAAPTPQQPRVPNLAADLLIPDPNNPGQMTPNTALIGVRTGLARAGAPSVSVSTDKAYSGVIAAGAGKQDLEQISRAQIIPQDFAKIDETLNILKKTDINTGLGADLFTVLDKARAQVTADKKAGTRAVNTEYLDSLLGSAVFPQIQALGIGARGMDTPAEREFLRKVMTGSIGLTKDTLIKMTELRRKGLENESAQFNKRVEKGEFKPYEEAARRKVEPIKVTPLVAPIFAVNPATRARIQSTDNGATWQSVGSE